MTCVHETSAHADKNEARLFRMICSAVKRELPEDAVFVDDADSSNFCILTAQGKEAFIQL